MVKDRGAVRSVEVILDTDRKESRGGLMRSVVVVDMVRIDLEMKGMAGERGVIGQRGTGVGMKRVLITKGTRIEKTGRIGNDTGAAVHVEIEMISLGMIVGGGTIGIVSVLEMTEIGQEIEDGIDLSHCSHFITLYIRSSIYGMRIISSQEYPAIQLLFLLAQIRHDLFF